MTTLQTTGPFCMRCVKVQKTNTPLTFFPLYFCLALAPLSHTHTHVHTHTLSLSHSHPVIFVTRTNPLSKHSQNTLTLTHSPCTFCKHAQTLSKHTHSYKHRPGICWWQCLPSPLRRAKTVSTGRCGFCRPSQSSTAPPRNDPASDLEECRPQPHTAPGDN